MIGGMIMTAMMMAVAYARRGVCEAMRAVRLPTRPAGQQGLGDELRDRADLGSEALDRVRRHEDPAAEQQDLRHQDEQQQRHPQGAGLGQGVVDAGQDPREVQRQDAVALVAPEQLRALGRREQHDQDHDDARGRWRSGRATPPRGSRRRPGAWAAIAEMPTARTAGRRAQPTERDRDDLGAPAAADAEARPQRRSGRAPPRAARRPSRGPS